jgi:hypothetical protein
MIRLHKTIQISNNKTTTKIQKFKKINNKNLELVHITEDMDAS